MAYRVAPAQRSLPAPSAARATARIKSMVLVFGVALLATVAIPAITMAAPTVHQFVGSGTAQGAWLVQFRSDIADSAASRLVKAIGATEIGQID